MADERGAGPRNLADLYRPQLFLRSGGRVQAYRPQPLALDAIERKIVESHQDEHRQVADRLSRPARQD